MTDIQIDEKADVAIWIQIRNRIVYLIRSGRYQPGDRLPSVRDLAVKLNINFNTVAKTYPDLERDGIIETKRGRGTFVCKSAADLGAVSDSPLDILIEELVKLADSNGVADDELLFRIEQRLSQKRS